MSTLSFNEKCALAYWCLLMYNGPMAKIIINIFP